MGQTGWRVVLLESSLVFGVPEALFLCLALYAVMVAGAAFFGVCAD